MNYLKNFKELITLINDSLSNKVALFAGDAAKYTDQAIREAFFTIINDDKLTWQNWRNHKNEIFTVMETVLTTNLPLAWDNSPFYEQFVDKKNGALGDKNEFVVEDNSLLVSSRFSGNYWSTDRIKIQGKKAFSIQTEWIYLHIYDELERFLKGTVTISDMIKRLQKSFQNEIDTRIFTAFNGAGTYIPAAFQESGSYDRKSMANLIERVQTASQKNCIIAATRMGLAEIAEGMNASLISESQKEEYATNGCLLNLTGLGINAIMIPQAFVRGKYDFKVDNKTIYILPDAEKPIKLFFEGDTRAREGSYQDNNDQTIDTQVQTKLGCATVFSNLIGVYSLA